MAVARPVAYVDFLTELLRYPQVMEIITRHTFGKVWLVGGSITRELHLRMRNPSHRRTFDYRNLYSAGEFPYRDLDFIAEEVCGKIKIPPEWSVETNTFGGMKFRSKSITVDLWKLRKHDPCARNNMPYTIENVVRLAPLDVQAIAADLQEGTIIGEPALRALETRTVSVNHAGEASHYCSVYGITLPGLLKKRAAEYSYKPIFP